MMIIEVIIVSFLKAVYPLKYPGNACFSYLDNTWLPVAVVLTNKTPNIIPLKYQSILLVSLSKYCCKACIRFKYQKFVI